MKARYSHPVMLLFLEQFPISHVRNEQETGYEYLISIELKNEPCHLKEHPKISNLAKFESYWFKRKGMILF